MAPLVVLGSSSIGNLPLVVLRPAIVDAPAAGTPCALTLVSTPAGNLLLTGCLAAIIAVERAARAGFARGILEHAGTGVPVTSRALARAFPWLVWRSGASV